MEPRKDEYDFTRVIVFGGTTEGRILADHLDQMGKLICVCVATEYGEFFLENTQNVRVGRLDKKQMISLFMEEKPTLVLDATHPYAVEVTKNIREACKDSGYAYIRVMREKESVEGGLIHGFSSMEEMITWLNERQDIIFSTLGAKEVPALRKISDYQSRVYVRVLPVEESLRICEQAGFDQKHIKAAMGPFSYEQNLQMFQETNATILLTKESGKAGGFAEKINAAMDCNLEIAVLIRPQEENIEETIGLEQLLTWMNMKQLD